MTIPFIRPRRLRVSNGIRKMVQETVLHPADFVYPLFVVPGKNIKKGIASLPGVFHLSADMAVEVTREAYELGIPAVMVFGLPEYKDAEGSSAWDDNSPVQKTISLLKSTMPELVVSSDVCLCQYTSHGHCGILKGETVNNDPTLELLAKVAVSHAKAGADMVAPSDMMDGRVLAIREALDSHGYTDVSIMSYAVKYASAFYGPFRDAADSTPQFGDRRTYQMDPANVREALREAELDINEGADIIMVKPALAYLDIISKVRDSFDLPVAAYNVSGEYAMIKAAAANGWIDEKRTVLETLLGMKRAGADIIITYHAIDAARWLQENR
ncbi:MAG TPA: porphobilinogen synthase [Negativicutes bacterium]